MGLNMLSQGIKSIKTSEDKSSGYKRPLSRGSSRELNLSARSLSSLRKLSDLAQGKSSCPEETNIITPSKSPINDDSKSKKGEG
jgi:hypothetical protein